MAGSNLNIMHRCEDNFETDLKETGCENVDCIHLAQDRVQWTAPVNIVRTESPGSIKGEEFLDMLSDYQLLKGSAPWSYLMNVRI
jgi:hypothetical protein